MTFSIPIFVQEETTGHGGAIIFQAQPLFHEEPVQRAEKLSRALARLSNDLHQLLRNLGQEPRHDGLAEWTFSPLLDEATLDLRLELRSGSRLASFFFAGYTALGRKLFFTPSLPDLHFEVKSKEAMAERATAVLTRHFREMERSGTEVDIHRFMLRGKARLTTLDLAIDPAALAKKKKPERAFIFGSDEKMDGEAELRKTGRRLNSMYPDDLERAVGRDEHVDEIARALASEERRPILLVGPRKVGKTAILHEVVWRIVARKDEKYGGGRHIWLVSPMRLISGMSHVGEWENRLTAILEHAKEKDRVLYFDDLLGLMTAGVSAASDFNVARALRPWIEKRSVRMVAEITPEAWRVLRERDRPFADLFQVIPIAEPIEPENIRILIHVCRELEETQKCVFGLDALPAAYELQRRFANGAAFPGKAAGFLRRLAGRYSGQTITRREALNEFHRQSGLRLAMLDEGEALERTGIVDDLMRGVIGQDHALETFADVIVTLKARLNDPGRPLAVLLLLGPTGVGKTEAAKALAAYLFGAPERLMRFDLNEYVDSTSVPRLTGTAHDPEGALTGALRRQPFSVILFDEVEKAAPEVLDLLLAVLDEGRLTDALGQTTDFTQSVILLTSNLGAREARSKLGFASGSESDDSIYVAAAEKFFRPEFFNRLDRIIPFRGLSPEHLEEIARRLINKVLSREGLRRRDVLLNVTQEALAVAAQMGSHPQFGARALKRVIEREVAQPMAEALAALPPAAPMIANLGAENGAFQLRLRDLLPAKRCSFWPEAAVQPRSSQEELAWTNKILDGARAALDRIAASLEQDAPSGRIELGETPVGHARYFYGKEHLKKSERLVQAVERLLNAPARLRALPRTPRPRSKKLIIRQSISGHPDFDRLKEAVSLRHDLADLEAESINVPDSPQTALLRAMTLLEAVSAAPPSHDGALLHFRAVAPGDSAVMNQVADAHLNGLGQIWGMTITGIPKGNTNDNSRALFIDGVNAGRLLPEGDHLILIQREDGGVGLILAAVKPATSPEEAAAFIRRPGDAANLFELIVLAPVAQHYSKGKHWMDHRTGVVVPAEPSADEFLALLISALPLPAEIERELRS